MILTSRLESGGVKKLIGMRFLDLFFTVDWLGCWIVFVVVLNVNKTKRDTDSEQRIYGQDRNDGGKRGASWRALLAAGEKENNNTTR